MVYYASNKLTVDRILDHAGFGTAQKHAHIDKSGMGALSGRLVEWDNAPSRNAKRIAPRATESLANNLLTV
jgi:hypothetical protein